MKNNFEKIIIIQGAGIGDILFCQKIAYMLHEKYQVPIIWPIVSHIKWISSYIISPAIFVDYDSVKIYQHLTQPTIIDNILYIPLHNSGFINTPTMEAKYKLCNLYWENWEKYIRLQRNFEKESELFNKLVENNMQYTYINKLYSTPPSSLESQFVVSDVPGKVVNHFISDEYNIFDWIKVAENAREIHTVSTCTLYIFEALQVKLPPIHVYNRGHHTDLNELLFLRKSLKQNWIFHDIGVK